MEEEELWSADSTRADLDDDALFETRPERRGALASKVVAGGVLLFLASSAGWVVGGLARAGAEGKAGTATT